MAKNTFKDCVHLWGMNPRKGDFWYCVKCGKRQDNKPKKTVKIFDVDTPTNP